VIRMFNKYTSKRVRAHWKFYTYFPLEEMTPQKM